MNIQCSYSECSKEASIVCDCMRAKTYLCITHLPVHTSQPGGHNTKKFQKSAEAPVVAKTYIKCETQNCNGLSKMYCLCNCLNMCLSCFENHLLASPSIKHEVEVRYNYRPTYDDLVHPLDMFLRRVQCDSLTISKIKARNITIRDILKWDLAALNSMSDCLGLNSTVKFLMWQEINYIKVVTEKNYLKNDYMAKLMFTQDDYNAII